VFQRSPPWIVPRRDHAYGPLLRAAHERLPLVRAGHRLLLYLALEARFAALRERDGWFARAAERTARRHLEAQVADPALRAALTPDHPIGCKRILLSDDYYPALARPDVRLVAAPVTALDADGVVAAGEHHPLDVLVWATGFETRDLLAPIAIHGRGGRRLADAWRDGPEAFLGVTVSGFPNLFLLYGPNTNLGHSSIVYMLESQIRYAISCLRLLRDGGLASLDVREDRQRAHNLELEARLARTAWTGGCTSWYRTPSGRVVNNWPSWTFDYRRRTRRVDPADYHLELARLA
jgi:cation diffusion facilitator CzcD-associated flavoprotein CzcO